MQLLCNGVYLDLYDNAGLQFTHSNPLFAFDELKCERTTNFKLPATPTNDRVFSLAKIPAYSGEGMRRKFTAQLQSGAVVKDGYLYVSNFDGKDYNAIFVTGELVGLQALKNAGKIRDLLVFDQAVTWDNTTTHTADESTLPDIGFVQYEREPSTAHLNASISLRWLMEKIATKTGVTINYLNVQGDERWRLLAAGADIYNINDLAVHLVNRGAVGQDPINLHSLLGISQYKASGSYYDKCTARSDGQYLYWGTDGQPSMAQFDMLKFPYEISLEFGEDFPNDCFLATDGWYGSGGSYHDEPICDMVYDEMAKDYRFIDFPKHAIAHFLGDYYLLWDGSTVGEPLAGRKVTIPANTPFMILPKAGLHYQEPNAVGDTATIGYDASEVPAYDYEVRISINHDFVYGEDVPMNAMLPEFTAVELLKLYAAINGCVLNYTDEQGVTFESLDFDNYATRSIETITKRGELVRTFSDYAQQNIVKMTPEDWVWLGERIKTKYAIDNDNIEEEKDLLVLKVSEGGKKIAYTNDGEVHTRLLVRNDADGKRKAKDQTIALASVDDPNMLRVTIPTIGGLQNLCDRSTQIKIEARMPLLHYDAIKPKTGLLVDGSTYLWTERSWQKDVAKMTLAQFTKAAVPPEPLPILPPEYQQVEWIVRKNLEMGPIIKTNVLNAGNVGVHLILYCINDLDYYFYGTYLTDEMFGFGLIYTWSLQTFIGSTVTPWLGDRISKEGEMSFYFNYKESGRLISQIEGGEELYNNTINIPTLTTPVNVCLFGVPTNAEATSFKYGGKGRNRLKFAEITQGQSVVARLIPCYRKSDNVAGMYDVVCNVFYTDSGVAGYGFEAGPDVNE